LRRLEKTAIYVSGSSSLRCLFDCGMSNCGSAAVTAVAVVVATAKI
jgi:uncharacterized membrane protein YadS